MRYLHCGCFTGLVRAMPASSVDCILTDPPFGETSLTWDRWFRDWPSIVQRILKPSGSMWVFGSTRMFMENAEQFVNWKFSHDVIWEKQNGSGLFNDRFRRVHESALHFYRGDAKWRDVYKCPQKTMDATARTVRKKGRPAQWIGATGETTYVSEDGGPRLARSVQYVRNMHGKAEHPTQKPEGIIEPLLLYACPPGGIVFDPFMGSATVGVVAAKHGMKFIGAESNPKYFEIAKRRLEK